MVLLRLLPPNHHAASTRASSSTILATGGPGDVLYLHQFTGSAIAAQLPAGAPRSWRLQTRYPWSGGVEITVRAAPEAEFGLAVRVPAWSPGVRLTLDGQPLAAAAEGGYLVARRRWQPGDVVTLDLDMRPRLGYPEAVAHRRIFCAAAVAVERGPLVYCFEQADHGEMSIEDLAVTASALGERPAPTALGESVAVTVPAVHLPAARPAYPDRPDVPAEGQPATAVAIPYFQWDNRDTAARCGSGCRCRESQQKAGAAGHA